MPADTEPGDVAPAARRPIRTTRQALQIILFTAFQTCLLFTLLSVLRRLHLDTAIWPANALAAGIYLLLVDVAALWCMAGVLAATLAAHLLLGDSGPYAMACALASALSFRLIVLGCRWADLRPGGRFDVRHVVGLVAVAFIAGLPGAGIGASAVVSEFGGHFWSTVLGWWLPDMASIVLLLPLFLLWPRVEDAPEPLDHALRAGHDRRFVALEYIVATAGLAGTALLVAMTGEPLLLEIGACILLWFAFRLGPFPTALAASLFAAAVLGLAVADAAHAPTGGLRPDLLKVQGRLVIAVCPALIIAAIMTQRERQQRALEEDQRRLAYALEGANDGIWDLHLPSDTIFFSARAYRMLGYNPDSDAGILVRFRELIHPDDLPEVETAFRDHAIGRRRLYQMELRGRHRSGAYVWLLSRGKVVEHDPAGRPLRAVGTITDISQKKHLEAALEHAASHDPLTGLANRATFDRALEQAGRRLARDLAPFAVLLIDVDHFKGVNDMHGHMAGDLMLTTTARRLQSALRAGDLAARFGGDEFAVVAIGKSAEEFASLADRLHTHLSKPVETEGLVLPTSFSIGMAVASVPDTDPTSLVAEADAALYLAKNAGRGTWRALGMRGATPSGIPPQWS
ncbi:diguanylate cyclase [Xanthobacter agilis]|uniref:Diguanylate cyclase (GGDEF)-like protein/PAS domain S-box-containing protein n=1 Tax=Xanthobacter agilis TaxID=47492 RepID=A0ABU0L9X0_XANAG|nr:diguanylate cyclase [Xanthobacter agilis]MDQ0503924.1 diguanylate cyclase (GGDEF)-like protein/PAS domain S-box-containing protein [Xanthobacter agilis]